MVTVLGCSAQTMEIFEYIDSGFLRFSRCGPNYVPASPGEKLIIKFNNFTATLQRQEGRFLLAAIAVMIALR